MKTKFTIVSPECGDWEALYINGVLAAENHSLSARDVLDCIEDIFPSEVESVEIPDEVAERGMPEFLNELDV